MAEAGSREGMGDKTVGKAVSKRRREGGELGGEGEDAATESCNPHWLCQGRVGAPECEIRQVEQLR